jgi:hypothetical protein
VKSVDAAPDMIPAIADVPAGEAAVMLTPAEEIIPAIVAATTGSKIQVEPDIITSVPGIVAVAVTDIAPTDVLPHAPTKAKKPRRKRENQALGGGAEKTTRPRKKSIKGLKASGMADHTASDERLPRHDLGGTSGAHSPP